MVSKKAVLTARAKLAADTRHHPERDKTVLRGDLAVANVTSGLSKITPQVASLTPQQRDAILAAFAGFVASGGAS